MKSMLAGMESRNAVLGRFVSFTGFRSFVFNPAMIAILDRFFANGVYQMLTREQEIFVSKFLVEAGKVTDAINNNSEMPRADMPIEFAQFDSYLGSYRG